MIKIKKQKEKKSIGKKKIAIISLFSIILMTILGTGVYVTSVLNKINKVEIDKNELAIDKNANYMDEKIRNIALFGIDSESNVGRSDAIMILTLDDVNKKMKLTSIMRDSYVDIPGNGMDKINHAYAFGGPELAIKTINQNFGLNIHEFISVNFKSLGEIVDVLGGVQIKITDEEISHIPSINKSGVHNLTGDQTLAYSRIRYAIGGDYQRTQRQRNILEAMYESFRYTSVTEYPKLLSQVAPYITTNISTTELLALGTDFSKVISSGLIQDRFPKDDLSKGINIDGVYYLQYDIEETKKEITDYIFKDIRKN